jgi:glycosyltransferase involved in cell wall biosynthesis
MLMQRIAREQLRAPARVIDLELTRLDGSRDVAFSVEGYQSVWCLSLMEGVPIGISFWDVRGASEVEGRVLAEHGGAEFQLDGQYGHSRHSADISLSVAICTRERPTELRRALVSLRDQSDREFEIIVIDNAPTSPLTAEVVEELGLARCKYVVEPQKGLSRARNTALAHVSTDHVAWFDDDEVADVNWVRNIKDGFSHDSCPVAVCGVMLPAELETEAQVLFEQYGGFNKGRGLLPEVLSVDSSSSIEPLYPLPAIGSGGNMAFQTEALIAAGGFDPHLGAGTRTHGGEETRVFATLLRSHKVVLHWPRAFTWHFHRRDMLALHKQFYGYSAGLSAFYASMIRSNPAVIVEILRLAPHALRDMGIGKGGIRADQLPTDFPKSLLREGRKGLLKGAFSYAYEAIRADSVPQ